MYPVPNLYQEKNLLEELLPHRQYIDKIISFTPGIAACGRATFQRDLSHFPQIQILRIHDIQGALYEIGEIAIRTYCPYESLKFLAGRVKALELRQPIAFLEEFIRLFVFAEKTKWTPSIRGKIITHAVLSNNTAIELSFLYGLSTAEEIEKNAITI
ncbi:MAG: hypothetical protein A2174_02500 [Candidatus Portnoybacteria bacterium RBG_13_41_18]|uniref:Uncharacterized protein n=1 Tax=Candidatus Portnoybacteria bacterium RBG_13_41_18 TaxID=1801991 RepID=A0A1G2FBS0_9BACT|nr:MAG: hypothetical protein A2174_02500 [Candidatus Portnoybacteria bacterium RBG_13_41_18]